MHWRHRLHPWLRPPAPPRAPSGRNGHLPHAVTPYDPLAAVYDQLYRDPISLAEDRLVFARLRRHLRPLGAAPGPVVLDLGCGTGLLLERCAIEPRRYLGVDCSEAMLACAQAKFPRYRFHLGYMEDLPPGLPPVDVAVALFGSFAYCQDQARAVRQVFDALTPGGLFICMPYTRRYPRRRAHQREEALGLARAPICHTAAQVARLLSAVACTHLTITGLNVLADYLPAWLPASLLEAWLWSEWHTLGQLWPDVGYFHYVEAWKGGH